MYPSCDYAKGGIVAKRTEWELNKGNEFNDEHVDSCIYCMTIIEGTQDCYVRKTWEDNDYPEDFDWEFSCLKCAEVDKRTD